MTSLLVVALITATASIYIVDVLDLVTRVFFSKSLLVKVLTLPIACFGTWVFGVSFRESLLLSPAIAVLSIVLSKTINRGVSGPYTPDIPDRTLRANRAPFNPLNW